VPIPPSTAQPPDHKAVVAQPIAVSPWPTPDGYDEWPGGANEPHDQGLHRQAPPLRRPRPARTPLTDFVGAYNFGRRLKTLKGLTPCEFICKQCTIEPKKFRINPLDQMSGLNMSWDEAFHVMAAKAKQVLKDTGPTAIGHSAPANGRSLVTATKLMRAVCRSNNARHSWPRPPSHSCAPSAWMSRWAATTTSRPSSLCPISEFLRVRPGSSKIEALCLWWGIYWPGSSRIDLGCQHGWLPHRGGCALALVLFSGTMVYLACSGAIFWCAFVQLPGDGH
jgi:hypothetical protein